MGNYDQKNQRVQNQYNADKIEININSPSLPTAHELLEKGKNLLRVKSYLQAIKMFEQCFELNANIAETYYYLSIALLRGNRPKLINLSTIRIIENHLKNAIHLQPEKGDAYILWALVKYDFYVLNGMFDRPPSYQDLLRENRYLSHEKANEILSAINAEGNFVWQWLKNNVNSSLKGT